MRALDRLVAAAAIIARKATQMPDQIIDAVMAQPLQADALRSSPLLAWIVLRDETEYPGQLVAHLVTSGPTPYVLLSDTLVGLHA